MTGSFQQQAWLRKLLYFGLIAVLFTATLLLRKHVVEVKADELELREQSQGDVELTGSAVYLSLSGSRGLVICYLWITANDKQARHEWNELEMIVSSLTKLQPHFIKPWRFQGWNLAYNVSVECDRVNDKYFYITRGMEVLARGQKKNRDHPTLRHDIGFFYQNKLGIADENNTLRSLFQLSCIDPRERDPKRFRHVASGETVIHFDEFQKFCEQHPFLVRRLRDKLRCDRPDKVIDFLADNERIPSLYDEKAPVTGLAQTPLKPVDERFPILPLKSHFDPTDINIEDNRTLGDDVDNYCLARTWFGFAQDPVDLKNRKSGELSKVIFQGTPARAQAYYAERLEQGGWFDEEGWTIDDWFPQKGSREMKEVTVPTKPAFWAGDAWNKAYEMYVRHGRDHGLLRAPEEFETMTPETRRDYRFGHSVTNFNHYYYGCQVKRTRPAMNSRKQFFKAERLRGSPREALRAYRHPDAFGEPGTWQRPTGWKRIFLDNPEFRRDEDNQIEAFELQLKYLQLERELPGGLGDQLRQLLAVDSILGHAAGWPLTGTFLETAWLVAPGVDVPLKGPFDDFVEDHSTGRSEHVPLIGEIAKDRVRGRLETSRRDRQN